MSADDTFEGIDSDTTDESVFRVTRMGAGQPYKTKSYAPTEEERVFYEFLSPAGERLGVQLNPDGTITVGGWDEDGEWIELKIRRPCLAGSCREVGHTVPFRLNQYHE